MAVSEYQPNGLFILWIDSSKGFDKAFITA